GRVRRLFEDSRGDVWIGTAPNDETTVLVWSHESGRIEQVTRGSGLGSSDYPTNFAEDPTGGLWVGFIDGVVARVRGHGVQVVPNIALHGSWRVLQFDDRGRLWIATSEGLCVIDDPQEPSGRCRMRTAHDGLSSNNVRTIETDRWQRVYLGTER